LQAAVVTLSVRNRISRRDTVELCEQLFSSRISTGTVDAILTRAADALAEHCEDLLGARRASSRRRVEHVAEFQTTVQGLLTLRDWLEAHEVDQVAMEATGVYWKPVWAVLEDRFELMLVNARHVKQVPGRKTDVLDAQWLCQLLEAGLLKASFVPPKPIRARSEEAGRKAGLLLVARAAAAPSAPVVAGR